MRARRRTASVGVPAVVTALALVLVACGSDRTSSSTGSGGRVAEERLDANAEVERVVDGDTIVADVRGSRERVRLIGIDTPESVKPNSPVECYGKEASAHTQELLPEGTRIRLVVDVEERDRYGRLLAYVYRASDGLFVNLALASDGYAGLLTYPPNVAHVEDFRAAVRSARQQGRGLWSACATDLPVTP